MNSDRRTREPLTRFLPFAAHDYVEMSMMLADSLGEAEGFGRLRSNPDVGSMKIGVGVHEDAVFVDLFTDLFNTYEGEFSIVNRFFNTDVLVMGLLARPGKFRVLFFVNPAIEDVVDARPADRFTSHQADAALSLSDEFARFAEFEADEDTPARLLSAATEVVRLFTDDSAAEVEVVRPDTLTQLTFAGDAAVSEMTGMGASSLAVIVPVLDEDVVALMDCLVAVPVNGLLFTQVSNPARIRSEGGVQTGNLLFLHAVPVS
ncbi:hypothetical protein [Microbacterium sp. p3-SID336]|uniref:hypothetical protein n=1 Tax=Microbacterium sp. p3-SID336 TaxID=2916212 RepID=UPI0021A3CBCB|nr:hypothetical protein [Microbacterium sp. p3-SID336]MCT1478684.1 hypothetical protein [Microbacterium sp. p3-SID336]